MNPATATSIAPVPTAPVPSAPVPTAPVPTAPVPTATNSLASKIQNAVQPPVFLQNAFSNAQAFSNNAMSKYNAFATANPTGHFILMSILAVLLFIVLFHIIMSILKFFDETKKRSPWILKASKNAKKRMIITQDPGKKNSVNLPRANNRLGGLEFTYCFWMYIDDMSYRYGQWKHVMHKGNKESWPLECPGVWLHPRKNCLRVYCNTFKEIREFVDIDNIPLNKWFCISLCAKGNKLDVYMNENLIKQKVFSSLIRQNYGDLYLNAFKGFSGYMSNIRYFDHYLPYAKIRNHLNRGPAIDACIDSNDTPPYYDATWWTNN